MDYTTISIEDECEEFEEIEIEEVEYEEIHLEAEPDCEHCKVKNQKIKALEKKLKEIGRLVR
ncbi:MAG: hypothetical protein ACI86H_002757 [bacterium]|jgi:hypothetical protein